MIAAELASRFTEPLLIGKGGMATVYRCYDSARAQIVALKVLNVDQDSAEQRARFCAEFSTLSELSHPNIVKVFELIETEDGSVAFTMEYLEGQSLSSSLDSIRSDPEFAIELLRNIALTVSYLHEQAVLYCDLSPANIILLNKNAATANSSNGSSTLNEPRFKLIDFGISQRLGTDGKVSNASTNVGTPRFISPEQLNGDALDIRTDV